MVGPSGRHVWPKAVVRNVTISHQSRMIDCGGHVDDFHSVLVLVPIQPSLAHRSASFSFPSNSSFPRCWGIPAQQQVGILNFNVNFYSDFLGGFFKCNENFPIVFTPNFRFLREKKVFFSRPLDVNFLFALSCLKDAEIFDILFCSSLRHVISQLFIRNTLLGFCGTRWDLFFSFLSSWSLALSR